MRCGKSIVFVAAALIAGGVLYPQVRPTPRTQRPVPTRAGPAYLQRLKSFEETQYVTKAVLRNGLTVLVHEFRAYPLAGISTWVRSGTLDESDDLLGASLVLERLLYRGTRTRAAGVIAREVRALGGELESATANDHTTYDLVVPSAQWKKALEIAADMLWNPRLDEQDLKQEVDAIRDETRFGLDDPDTIAAERLLALGFGQHRIRRGSLALDSALSNLSRTALLEHYRTAYHPARIILVVAGDVSSYEVLNEVTRLFDIAKGAAPKPPQSPVEKPQPDFRYAQVRGSFPVPKILLGYHAASTAFEDYPALEVLNAILGLGRGSVLARRLKDQKKVILDGNSELLALPDEGYLTIRMDVDPDNIDRAELAALTELELLKREELDTSEMERALAQLECEFWSGRDTVTKRAHLLARFEASVGWKRLDEWVSRLRKVQPEDVRRVAQKYLRAENCSLLECLPAGAEPRNLNTETARRTFQELLEPATAQEMAEREKEVVPAFDIPDSSNPFKFREVRFPLQTASVLRGPELYIREDHTLPLIHAGFFYAGGKLLEKKESAGVTALMLRSMLAGTRDRAPEQLHRQLEIYGARIRPVVADDYFGFSLTILSKHVEKGLALLAEIIKSPKFDAEAVSRQKQLQIAMMRAKKNSGSGFPLQLLNQALFADHPYGLDPDGSEISVAALDSEALRSWHKTTIENRKPMIVMIGDTEGTSLARFFVQSFSGARFQDVKLPDIHPKALDRRIALEEKRDAIPSQVLLGFQAPPMGDEDCYPLMLLENHLAGNAGRLGEKIREAQVPAYRVLVKYEPRARGGSIAASFVSLPADEEAVLNAVEGEISRLLEAPILYKDYRSAMNLSLGKYWIGQQARFSQIAFIVENILSGNGLEAVLEHATRLQGVKEEDLQEVARRVFKLDRSVALRVHGRS